MRTAHLLTCQLAASLALTLASAAQNQQAVAEADPAPAKPVMRDAATHEQLVELTRRVTLEKTQPVFTPREKDPAKENQPGDLISRSEILCFNGQATLVPKRAVIHIPKSLAARIAMQEGSRILPWQDFLVANRGWITTVNISRAQAEGNEPLSEATLKSFEKETRVVVATYEEGPISVLPLKTPPAETVATEQAKPR